MTSPILNSIDYCKQCHSVLRTLESCPRWYIILEGEIVGSTLEIIWFLGSFMPLFIYLAILIYSIAKRNTRGCYVLMNVFIQQIVCALMKLYIAQARPKGACSSSFGYPSGHSGFASAMVTWLILEYYFIPKTAAFRQSYFYIHTRNAFIAFAPFIPISRYFLNYHSLEQIAVGLIVGVFCSVLFFSLTVGYSKDNYKSILVKFGGSCTFQDKYVKQDDNSMNKNMANQEQEENSV